MLALGVIEQVNSPYSVKVRIPVLHLANGDVNSVPTENLPDATIATFSKSIPNYTVGTVVVVGFDRNDLTSPIVLGVLCTNKESDMLPDIVSGSVNVLSTCNLPQDTHIGNVNGKELQTLAGIKVNIQAQIDDLDRRITNLGG